MLKCRDVSELASDYLENTLPTRRRLAMRVHLMLCAMCRSYIDQLQKTTRLLGRGTLPPPRPDVEARLVAASREPPEGG